MKNHIWFRGVDWLQVQNKEIPAPWVPELASATDFQYFDDYQDMADHEADVDIGDEAQKCFLNF